MGIKQQFVFILGTILFLQSCSTAIITHKNHPQFMAKDRLNSKDSLTIRTGRRVDIRHTSSSIYKDKDFEEAVTAIFPRTSFQNVTYANIDPDMMHFRGEDSKERRDHYLKGKMEDDTSKYYLDIYTETSYNSPDNPMILGWILWGTIHLISLGLIPIYKEYPLKTEARLYDHNKKLIRKSKSVTYTKVWIWSPNIFRKDSRRGLDDDSEKEAKFYNIYNLTDKVLRPNPL